MIGYIKYILIFFCLAFVIGCGDDPSDIASGIDGDKLEPAKVSASQTTASTFTKVVELGTTSRLLIGKSDNTTSSFLIKFDTPMLDSILSALRQDSIRVISNKIYLHPIYKFGDSTAVLDFTANKILSTWDSYTFTSDSLSPLRYDYQNILAAKSINNDTLHYLSINNSVLQEWLEAKADSLPSINNGIFVKPTSTSNRIVGYQGFQSGSSFNPNIEIVYEKIGAYTDTLVYYTDQDVHVIEGSIPVLNADEIIVQSGISIQGRMNFVLDSIPSNVSINYAAITLTLDTIKSKFGTNIIQDLSLYYITDSSTNAIDLSSSATLKRDKDKYSGIVTTIINRMYRDGNYGVLIRPTGYLEGVEKYILKTHLSSVPADAPKIDVIFTKRK